MRRWRIFFKEIPIIFFVSSFIWHVFFKHVDLIMFLKDLPPAIEQLTMSSASHKHQEYDNDICWECHSLNYDEKRDLK